MESSHPFIRVLLRFSVLVPLLRTLVGQRTWAVTALTWKAAFRFRLFWVLAGLLLCSVVVLPLLVKDDGTARGFIQIMLTYTLSVVTTLLGFSTLWLACGTLARDIEDCSMQMVAVKPIARWQIWLGKWLGILLLNATLLALAGGGIFGLLTWRTAQMGKALARALAAKDEKLAVHLATQLRILGDEIFVARGSLKEPMPDIESDVDRQMERLPNKESLSPEQLQETRVQFRERIKALQQVVPPNHLRRWTIDLGLQRHLLRDQPLFLRVKFYAAQTNETGTYLGLWQVGPPESGRTRSLPQSLAANTFHEMMIPPNLFDESGRLTIDFENRNNATLIFPLQDGLEVLYREGGFGLNFSRGLGIIWCWLALLAALGLASASLLSFPVAAFFSIGVLIVALSSGTLANVVQEGTVMGVDHEGGAGGKSPLDFVTVLVFECMLYVINLTKQTATIPQWLADALPHTLHSFLTSIFPSPPESFSPVDALSTGRSITWGTLIRACAQMVLLFGGVLAVTGIALFTRRELATAQGAQ